jgi:hypothetical protein
MFVFKDTENTLCIYISDDTVQELHSYSLEYLNNVSTRRPQVVKSGDVFRRLENEMANDLAEDCALKLIAGITNDWVTFLSDGKGKYHPLQSVVEVMTTIVWMNALYHRMIESPPNPGVTVGPEFLKKALGELVLAFHQLKSG